MTGLRTRVLGETIGNGDFIVAGEQRFTAIEACIVGQVIRTTGRIQVLTYEPEPIDMVALAKNLCFPPKPVKPACENCGEPSEYSIDSEDRCPTDRGIEVRSMKVYLCRECYEQFRERHDA
jgi:hypothetical protein